MRYPIHIKFKSVTVNMAKNVRVRAVRPVSVGQIGLEDGLHCHNFHTVQQIFSGYVANENKGLISKIWNLRALKGLQVQELVVLSHLLRKSVGERHVVHEHPCPFRDGNAALQVVYVRAVSLGAVLLINIYSSNRIHLHYLYFIKDGGSSFDLSSAAHE